jgi:hypothetical protein
MRRQQGAALFAQLNDEATKHAREYGTVRDTDGRQVGYDAKRATQAYAQWWSEQRKAMPPHIRALIDDVGNEHAKAIMEGGKAPSPEQQGANLGRAIVGGGDNEDPAADIPGAEEHGEPMMEPLVPVPSSRPTTPERAPETRNFGTQDAPNWRERRNGSWVPVVLPSEPKAVDPTTGVPAVGPAGTVSIPVNGDTPTARRNAAIAASMPLLRATETNTLAPPAPVDDRSFLTQPAPPLNDAAVIMANRAMRRGGPPAAQQRQPAAIPAPPEWKDPAVRSRVVGMWRNLMTTNPDEFKRQLQALHAAGDERYLIIKNDIRGTP